MYKALLKALVWLGMRNRRVIIVDACCIAIAVFIGYSMRFSYFFLTMIKGKSFYSMLASYACFIMAALIIGKTYTVVWTRASIEEYARFAQWYFIGVAAFIAFNYFTKIVHVPRSSFLILMLLALMFMTGIRAAWRLAWVSSHSHGEASHRMLIVGAGEAGTLLARDLIRNRTPLKVIGFIDDDPSLRNMTVASTTT